MEPGVAVEMLAVCFTVREEISQHILHKGSLQGASGGGAVMKIVKLRSRSRSGKGQVQVRGGSGRSESGLSHVNLKTST